MQNELSRRRFLERVGGSALGGAALSQGLGQQAMGQPLDAPQNTVPWAAPPSLVNPNILLIMADQMRFPQWLSAAQLNTLQSKYLPNIFGRLGNNSYVFQNYFTAGTACVPSRATLLTGLYSPQTCIFTTNGPALNTAYPTWGSAIRALNPAYQNVWWFGKWHLSDPGGTSTPNPLLPYGFQNGLYPGGLFTNPVTGKKYYAPSPDGTANEGLNGGLCPAGQTDQGGIFANDAMIADDFVNWIGGLAGYSVPATPWCATVSLINPHDISRAPKAFTSPQSLRLPAWYPSDFPTYPPTPPSNVPQPPIYNGPSYPSTWTPPNWEDITMLANEGIKPSWQLSFYQQTNAYGIVTDWPAFLNEYYWLHYYVDLQVGKILSALNASPFLQNTVIIFISDHGDFGGSHGLHDKSGAVYDESIHIPLYVRYPGHRGAISMNQMCSSVDFFGFMCDLVTSGSGLWKTAYPDLMNRQSIWSFLSQNAAETRQVSIGGAPPEPYILHTVDETEVSEFCPGPSPKPDNRHIICLRTKSGGKLGYYSHWGPATTCWDGVTTPEYEFYNYSTNTAETGNQYPTDPLAPQYLAALGSWGPPPWGANGAGIIASELDAPLSAKLQPVQSQAQQAFVAFSDPCGT